MNAAAVTGRSAWCSANRSTLVPTRPWTKLSRSAAPSRSRATYGETRGNPVLIGREYWNEALALTGDEGARVLLRQYGAVEIPCDGTGDPTDVDTPEELAALETRLLEN